MTVALAVLWWNHPELWPGFAELAACGGWDELVVIDDGSTAENHAFLEEAVRGLGPRARLFTYPENDPLPASNAALATVQADLIVGMPNDYALLDRRWFEWVIEDSRPGILQGPLQNAQLSAAYIEGILAIWREDWRRLGGHDTGYLSPGYWEDVDLGWRAQRLGMAIRLTRCGVRHIGGATTGGTPDEDARRRWLANWTRFRQRMASGQTDKRMVTDGW